MFAVFDEVPTSTSLLIQCRYRSKVCTNVRGPKLDGELHKLCEFHRRKANENQQRLYQRQRRRAEDAANNRPGKRTRLNIEVGSEFYEGAGFPGDKFYPHSFFDGVLAPTTFTPVDVDIPDVLLLDVQPLPPNSPTAVDAEFLVV